jgi:hypothetical protein
MHTLLNYQEVKAPRMHPGSPRVGGWEKKKKEEAAEPECCDHPAKDVFGWQHHELYP